MSRLLILKLGTRILTAPASEEPLAASVGPLAESRLRSFLSQVLALREQGWSTLIVTSGAVALGRARLKLSGELTTAQKQACASVGQSELIQTYQRLLSELSSNRPDKAIAGQVLLSSTDLADRIRYLNLRTTLSTLLEMGVMPILNENDTLSDSELVGVYERTSFSDNDQLASLVAVKLQADLLILLTDVEGIFSANPSTDPHARKLSSVDPNQLNTLDLSGTNSIGRGGMSSKALAASRAAICGTTTLIASGFTSNVVLKCVERFEQKPSQKPSQEPIHEPTGTLIPARGRLKKRRTGWLLAAAGSLGQVIVNGGAQKKLVDTAASLLAVGVVEVQGEFEVGDVVSVVSSEGNEFGRGQVRLSSDDLRRVLGLQSQQASQLLGRQIPEVIHRNDLVLFTESALAAALPPGKMGAGDS